METYAVDIVISKQEDGLWRAEVPVLSGCFVDAETLEEALADIQDAIKVSVANLKRLGWPLPKDLERPIETLPIKVRMPVSLQ